MAEITKIKPQRNKKRVNIYLDGKFSFGLDLENFMKLGLKVGQELTESKVVEIVKKAEYKSVLDKLLRFATLRPRSEKEVFDWLKRKKIHKSLHDNLFKRIKRLKLIDDTKFAGWWVEQRLKFRPRSKRILKQELRFKGVDRYIIEDVLDEVAIDELKIAQEILRKKRYRWMRLGKVEAKKKMSEFLARKGFSWDTIKKVVS